MARLSKSDLVGTRTQDPPANKRDALSLCYENCFPELKKPRKLRGF
jgi:hypothetical protein